MVWILVQGAEPFCVHDHHLNGLTIWSLSLKWLGPHPNTFGAWVDSRSNTETIRSIEKHSIEQVALTCTVHACHCNNTDWSFQCGQELFSFLIYFKHYEKKKEWISTEIKWKIIKLTSFLFVEDDEWDCLLDLWKVGLALSHENLVIHMIHGLLSQIILWLQSITNLLFNRSKFEVKRELK